MALILSASLLQLFPYLDENMSVDYLSPTFSRRLHAFFYFGHYVAKQWYQAEPKVRRVLLLSKWPKPSVERIEHPPLKGEEDQLQSYTSGHLHNCLPTHVEKHDP